VFERKATSTSVSPPVAVCDPGHHFLESRASPAANPIQQPSDYENSNDQSDRANSPTRAEAPIQTSASSKQHQQYNQDYQQIHVPLLPDREIPLAVIEPRGSPSLGAPAHLQLAEAARPTPAQMRLP
jgi:hypothetical protein